MLVGGVVLAGCGDGLGPGATLTIVAGNAQVGSPGDTLPIQLQVAVADGAGQPVANVSIRWAVTGGAALLTQDHSKTGSDGRAATTLILGNRVGEVSVRGTASSLAPVSFTARALDPCIVLRAYQLGDRVEGRLSGSDCVISDDTPVQFYQLELAAPQSLRIVMQSTAVDAYLFLLVKDGAPVGFDDDGDAGTDAALRALLPAGSFVIGANSIGSATFGLYTLTSAAVPSELAPCEIAWTAVGAGSAQSLSAADCDAPDNIRGPADHLFLYLTQGTGVTVDLESPDFDPVIVIFSSSGVALAQGVAGPPGDASMAFTASVSGAYVLQFRPAAGAAISGTGSYTWAVN